MDDTPTTRDEGRGHHPPIKLWEHLPPNDHVFWKLCGFVWVSGIATVFLVANASHFDGGEIKAILGIAGSVMGFQWFQGKAPKA